MSNVYQKLQTCRVELQGMNIKKSGKNKHTGAAYYELSDFLPQVNGLFDKLLLTSAISFDSELAILTIFNSEEPSEMIVFTCPMSTAKLPNCHDVQNLGAVISYERRYLYMNALEIVEHDALDGTIGDENVAKATTAKPTDKKSPPTEPEPQGDGKVKQSYKECPNCGGQIWDNRAKKASGTFKANSPDFSCRDKDNCGWVAWGREEVEAS